MNLDYSPTLLMIGLVAVVNLSFGVGVAVWSLTRSRQRIEHGFSAPAKAEKTDEQSARNAFWLSFWLALGVPFVAFSTANEATQAVADTPGFIIPIWICAGLTSIASSICATVLMVTSRSGDAKAKAIPRIYVRKRSRVCCG